MILFSIKKIFKNLDIVLITSTIVAFISLFIWKFNYKVIDFNVLITLLSLMLIIEFLTQLKFIEYLSEMILKICKTKRHVAQAVTIITFIVSMFVTNDVGIIVMVPIFLNISKTYFDTKSTVIILTLIITSANLGSGFFVIGNPQNIFLYNFYSLDLISFSKITIEFSIISLLLLLLSTNFINNGKIYLENRNESLKSRRHVFINLALLISVVFFAKSLHFLLFIVVLIGIYITLYKREIFSRIDYGLLWTFICFFIIIGAIKSNYFVYHLIKSNMNSKINVYISAISISQLFSNVPTAILLSAFTKYKEALILGVNIGGLGTLIASMANLIGYRLIKKDDERVSKVFLKYFYIINLTFLLILVPIVYIIIK